MARLPISRLPETRGSYALLLHLSRPRRIRVGRLGSIAFPAGCYVYLGSAFGPGGLKARIAHHLKRSIRPHWHIDYLRRACTVEAAWLTEGERMECAWARRLHADDPAMAVPGFGCSDCRCPSHLFRVETR